MLHLLAPSCPYQEPSRGRVDSFASLERISAFFGDFTRSRPGDVRQRQNTARDRVARGWAGFAEGFTSTTTTLLTSHQPFFFE